jgi:hypothetical protein
MGGDVVGVGIIDWYHMHYNSHSQAGGQNTHMSIWEVEVGRSCSTLAQSGTPLAILT